MRLLRCGFAVVRWRRHSEGVPWPPVEPPASPWSLPDAKAADPAEELVGIGADLDPSTVLQAYRAGLFPMPLAAEFLGHLDGAKPIGWWSPNPRAILDLDAVRISRSLRKSLGRFEIRVDSAFDDVISACGDPSREHGWINDEVVRAYRELFRLGWVHSIEAWDIETGTLAGGLYGVAINGLFAGESMFHRDTDASKVALVALVALLRQRGYALLDVQWQTNHLASLGVMSLSRLEYHKRLGRALTVVPKPLGPLENAVRVEFMTPVGEAGKWTTPLQFVDISKQVGVEP